MDKYVLVKITEIANKLDDKGLYEEASLLDGILEKEAQFGFPIGLLELRPEYEYTVRRKVEPADKVSKEKSKEVEKAVRPEKVKGSEFQKILEKEIKK